MGRYPDSPQAELPGFDGRGCKRRYVEAEDLEDRPSRRKVGHQKAAVGTMVPDVADHLVSEATAPEVECVPQVANRDPDVVESCTVARCQAQVGLGLHETGRLDVLVAQAALDELQTRTVRVEEEGNAYVAKDVARRREDLDTRLLQPAHLRIDVADLEARVSQPALQVLVQPLAGVALLTDQDDLHQGWACGEPAGGPAVTSRLVDFDLVETEQPPVEVPGTLQVARAELEIVDARSSRSHRLSSGHFASRAFEPGSSGSRFSLATPPNHAALALGVLCCVSKSTRTMPNRVL